MLHKHTIIALGDDEQRLAVVRQHPSLICLSIGGGTPKQLAEKIKRCSPQVEGIILDYQDLGISQAINQELQWEKNMVVRCYGSHTIFTGRGDRCGFVADATIDTMVESLIKAMAGSPQQVQDPLPKPRPKRRVYYSIFKAEALG